MKTGIDFAISLDMVNLNHQEPNRNRYESKYYWDELLTLIPAAGFTSIELPYQPKWDFGGRSGIPFTQYAIETKYGSVKKFVARLNADGIKGIAAVSFDPSLFISSNLDAYFGAFGHFASQAVKFTGEAGSKILNITPTPCIGLLEFHLAQSGDWSKTKNDFLKRTADLINSLAVEAASCGVTIVLKSEYWSLLRETGVDEIFSQIDPGVRRNIDTAHIQIAGGDPATQISQLAGRIGSVHFTDTAFSDTGNVWREVSPEFPAAQATQVFRDIGQGNVNLAAAYQALQQIGYQGWIACSSRQTRDPMRALLRTRQQIDQIITKNEGGAGK